MLIFASEVAYQAQLTSGRQRRLSEHRRTLYRNDDCSGPLPFAQGSALALPYESYTLAFTPGLVQAIYVDSQKLTVGEVDSVLAAEGGYVHSEGDANWWIPSGQVFFHPDPQATPAQEYAFAQQHFWLPQRFRDPFQHDTLVRYDAYDLLVLETEDALQNTVTAGAHDSQGAVTNGNDYRLLQPALLTDPNGNQSAVAFDILGLVAGSAAMGKGGEGDTLQGNATTRILYDVGRDARTGDAAQPTFAATLARERHVNNLQADDVSPVQVSLGYTDGFGRESQKKVQAEPGPVVAGGPVVTPRWVGSGWTIFNNKGKPVRQYEPFFSATHDFEFANSVGVSATLLYDPVGRVVATLHPNHTYEKVVFDPWRQATWDVNDMVLQSDPQRDADVGDVFHRLPEAAYLPTWYSQRIDGALGPAEQTAALQTVAHANTPTVAWFDTLRRPVLTYDALYRLAQAQGREHIGQSAFQFDTTGGTNRDYPFVGLAQLSDLQAVRNYTEQYAYDAVGNVLQVVHQAKDGGWTRDYTYSEPSLLDLGKASNRLSRTTVGAITEPYAHDVHGNMTSMPHLSVMQWDAMNQLSVVSHQVVNNNPLPMTLPETTYSVYDGSGQRVRKVTERQNSTRKNERIYLGGFELYLLLAVIITIPWEKTKQ